MKGLIAFFLVLIMLTGAASAREEENMPPVFEVTQCAIPDTEAMNFVKDMKVGWNLGNTFDAKDCAWLADELLYESAWCGAVTTPEMIDALIEAGFQTVRIPVSWHDHVSPDDYAISPRWLSRVKEVVDYAYERDLYVILNTHHDNVKGYYYPDKAHLAESKRYICRIWEQLSETFREYDERLLFESMNEPRLAGTPNEWWLDPSSAECTEAVECINELNQVFVDTVRAAGGANAARYLLIPGYSASMDGVTHAAFKLPTDAPEAKNKLILSVHAYTPYNFALQSPKDAGSKDTFRVDAISDTKPILSFMDKLYLKYVKSGIPVLIGEFGARDKDGNITSRVHFTAYYVACARAHGITCLWWDNNSFRGDGENFGLLSRKDCVFEYPTIIEALMKWS